MMRRSMPLAALALGAALASAPALAHDLSWSVTIGSGGAVGVHVGVPAVAVVTPAPVVVARPRYVHPVPVVVAPPRHVVMPAWSMVPAYAAPVPVYMPAPVTYLPHAHGKRLHAGHRGNGHRHPRHR